MTQRLLISFLLLAVLGQGLSAQKLGGRLKKLLGKDKTEQALDTAALPASYVLADGLMARALTVDLAGREPDGIFVQSLVFVTQMDEKATAHLEAIILSMTPKERENPNILGNSRKKRIAAGSGTSVMEVNRLLKQYDTMLQLFKQMNGPGGKKMKRMAKRGGFPGMGSMGGMGGMGFPGM